MDRRLFFLLNMAQHRLFKEVNERTIETLGVTATQVAALFFLHKRERGAAQKELATALGLNKATASGLASRMERDGLIERRVSAADGRAFELVMTRKAKRLVPKAKPLLEELNQLLVEGFSDEEIDVVLRFLKATMTRFEG